MAESEWSSQAENKMDGKVSTRQDSVSQLLEAMAFPKQV